jgi:O-glycosyl hydrolase
MRERLHRGLLGPCLVAALLLLAGACRSGGGTPSGAAGTGGQISDAGSPQGGTGGGAAGDVGRGGSGGTAAGVAGTMGGAGVAGGGGAMGGAGVAGSGGRAGSQAGGTSGGAGASGAAGGIVDAGSDAPRGPVTPAPGATLVKVDPAARRQTFEGWGTSLCWWANRVGGWSTTARNAVVDAIVDPAAGLGYNIFRYNIGGGENPAHDHMGQWREMPGFQDATGTWNWDADANQRNILRRIVERDSNAILEAFSNSPPYWMTKSGCASGNTDGSNNLKDDSYEAFADYLTEVVEHYRDAFGITFRTLEPLNEPNANWWTANGSQEGCHFGASNQQQIIKAVGASLAAKGLTATTVGASDENSLDDAYNVMRNYDAATLGFMSQMNGHSYSASASSRANLRGLAAMRGKRLWQSESGPLNVTLANNTEAAMFMAGRIITDLRDLQPNAWLDWQVGDPASSWASISLSDGQQTWSPLKRFYMHAGFSRFIRPGAVMLAVDGPDMVAFIAGDGATLAIVIRNEDMAAAKSFTFDLTAVPFVGAQVAAYRTSRTENLASLPAIPVQNWSFTVSAAAYSLTSLVLPLR